MNFDKHNFYLMFFILFYSLYVEDQRKHYLILFFSRIKSKCLKLKDNLISYSTH